MDGQSVLSKLEKLFSLENRDRRFLTALRYFLAATLAYLLSLARTPSGGAPFAIALVAAAGTGWSGAAVLLGAALGYLLGGGLGWGIRYIAASVLTFTTAYIFQEFSFASRPLFMPFCAALITALTAFLGSFSLSGASVPDAAALILETVLAFGGAYFFRIAIENRSDLSEQGEIRHSVSVTLLAACALMALVPWKLFDLVSIGRTLALIVLMASALKGGMLTGAAAGTVLGITTDLASGGSCFYAMAYALSGLLGGVFSRHSRLVFTLSFVLASALAATCAWSGAVSTAALFETFCASVIFILLPARFLGSLGMFLHDSEHGSGERDLRRFVANKVKGLGEAYGELYGIVESSLCDNSNDNDIARVFDRAADRVCVHCVNKNRCWNADYLDTLSALNDATKAMCRNGSLTAEDIPGFFRSKCTDLAAFIGAVNSELRAQNYRRELKSRLAEKSAVAWEQYADMAHLLTAVSDELGSVNGSDLLAEQRLLRYLRSIEIDAEVSVYRDGRGRLRAAMESGSLVPLTSDPGYLERLSNILGVRVCLPQGTEVSDVRLVVLEAEPLAVSVGIAALKKRGERVSGDKGSYFKTDSGVLCVILSDGMGTGDEAARDSAQVVAILEKFLRSGADGAAAMKVLNSALLLRSGENWGFATVDLMCIDLFSGETCFYKYGAAPSYVRNGRTVRRIKGETLAAGLSLGGGSAPDVVRMKLQPGSTAIIASDGVIADGEDEWVKNMLLRSGEDMKSLAKNTLREAEKLYGSGDDMTVVTVRVEERV
ncbi:MAG TPA: hypothetical protein DCM61_01410 [Clostridiales bacterium]|nr:hypothetical protein [Clostridiales bacterium]